MEPRVLDAYLLPPGCDYITGGSPPGRVIDTGKDIDRLSKYGRIYLSERTVGQYARQLGWISPDDFAELSAALVTADERIAELEVRNGKLGRIRDALVDAGMVTADDGPGAQLADQEPPAVSTFEPEPQVEVEGEPGDDGTQYPVDQGSGWYLLSNGEKVRGADDAHAAEAAIRRGEA